MTYGLLLAVAPGRRTWPSHRVGIAKMNATKGGRDSGNDRRGRKLGASQLGFDLR